MGQELVYTSAPKGLKPGSKGFCTVAMTAGLAQNWAEKLESLSGYRAIFPLGNERANDNPVSFAHWRLSIGGKTRSVLSRVAFAGADFSQRSNKFAHHVVLEPQDQASAGPAWMMRQPSAMRQEWTQPPQQLSAAPMLPRGQSQPKPCRAWENVAGDAAWAAALVEGFVLQPTKPIFVIYPLGIDVLELFDEALSLLDPAKRWDVTFSTFFTELPLNLSCAWRGVAADSPAAQDALRQGPRATVIDLTKPLIAAAPTGAYADAARSGSGPVIEALPPASAAVRAPNGAKLTLKPDGDSTAPAAIKATKHARGKAKVPGEYDVGEAVTSGDMDFPGRTRTSAPAPVRHGMPGWAAVLLALGMLGVGGLIGFKISATRTQVAISQLTDEKTSLEAINKKLEDDKQKLEDDKKALGADKQKLEADNKTADAERAKLSEEIATLKTTEQKLKQDKQELTDKLAIAGAHPSNSTSKGEDSPPPINPPPPGEKKLSPGSGTDVPAAIVSTSVTALQKKQITILDASASKSESNFNVGLPHPFSAATLEVVWPNNTATIGDPQKPYRILSKDGVCSVLMKAKDGLGNDKEFELWKISLVNPSGSSALCFSHGNDVKAKLEEVQESRPYLESALFCLKSNGNTEKFSLDRAGTEVDATKITHAEPLPGIKFPDLLLTSESTGGWSATTDKGKCVFTLSSGSKATFTCQLKQESPDWQVTVDTSQYVELLKNPKLKENLNKISVIEGLNKDDEAKLTLPGFDIKALEKGIADRNAEIAKLRREAKLDDITAWFNDYSALAKKPLKLSICLPNGVAIQHLKLTLPTIVSPWSQK